MRRDEMSPFEEIACREACDRFGLASGRWDEAIRADPRYLGSMETWPVPEGLRGVERPAPTLDSLSARIDALEREMHESRQRRLGAHLRRGWSALRSCAARTRLRRSVMDSLLGPDAAWNALAAEHEEQVRAATGDSSTIARERQKRLSVLNPGMPLVYLEHDACGHVYWQREDGVLVCVVANADNCFQAGGVAVVEASPAIPVTFVGPLRFGAGEVCFMGGEP